MAEEVQNTDTAVMPVNQSIVMPAVGASQAVEAWKQYEELKSRILDPKTDVQKIGANDFKKKSYWKKLGTFFNLDTTVLSERREKGVTSDPMDFTYHFTVRTTAPNGRVSDAVGSCSSYEKAEWRDEMWVTEKKVWKSVGGKNRLVSTGEYELAQPNTEHNVRSTAFTRASNRSISDLVGGGEVSAEEVAQGHERDDEPVAAAKSTKSSASTKSAKEEAPDNVDVATGEIIETSEKNGKEDADWIKEANDPNSISDYEIDEMYKLAEDRGFSKEQVDQQLDKTFSVKTPKDLDREGYERVMNGLTQSKKKTA